MRKTFSSILMRVEGFLHKERALILFSLIGLLAGDAARFMHPRFPDDAFITFRYAQNLAMGLGMTYHPGERILGTTTPFYASILAGGIRLGLTPVFLSGLIDLFTFGLMLFFVLKIAKKMFSGFWWLWLWAALVLNFSWISLTGMETWLYSFLIYWTFWSLMKDRPWATSMGSVLCALLRPEGLLVWTIVFPILIYRYIGFPEEKRKAWRYPILSGLLLLLAGLLIPTLYFGSWLPHSILIKQEQVTLAVKWKSYFTGIFEKYHYSNGYPTPLMLVMLAGLVWGFLYHPQLRPLLSWGFLYQLFMILGKAPWYEWYETPVIPWFFLCVAAFWNRTHHYAKQLFGEKANRAADFRIQLSILLLSVIFLFPVWKRPQKSRFISSNRIQTNLRKMGNIEAARWMASHTPSDAKVAAIETGIPGYYSGRRIHDLIGMVTPDPGLFHRRTSPWDIAMEKRCDYILYPFANLPGDFLSVPSKLFWRNYRMEGFWKNSDKGETYEIPILFGAHTYQNGEKKPLSGNISAPLRRNTTGLVIFDSVPHTALKGIMEKEASGGISWTFIADSQKMKLEFTPTILPPHVFGGKGLIEEDAGGGKWEEKFCFPINPGKPVICEVTSSRERPVIRIMIFPDRFPDCQGFYLLDATTTSLDNSDVPGW
jgi:hypothetical protein